MNLLLLPVMGNMKNLLNKCLQESLVERNKLPSDNVQVSSQIIRFWEKKLDLRIVTLQMITEARVKACKCSQFV